MPEDYYLRLSRMAKKEEKKEPSLYVDSLSLTFFLRRGMADKQSNGMMAKTEVGASVAL